MRIVYVNGEFVPEADAKISVFDRGFLFADAVYEGVAVIAGKLVDFKAHMDRLARSCGELDIPLNFDYEQLLDLNRQIVARNDMAEGFIYLQMTRGSADRDFAFDNTKMQQSLVIFTQSKPLLQNPKVDIGITVVSVDDLRWGRCDIKTVQLLYPSLAKMEAVKQGADDAWFVKDGMVMEGTSNNAFIVTKDDVIVTRQLSNAILPGITRSALLKYTNETGLRLEERGFTLEEAYEAKEAFITSSSLFVMPVTHINKKPIGDGKSGDISKRLRKLYIEESLKTVI